VDSYRLLREAFRAAPGNVEALTALGDVEWGNGHYEDALVAYRRATTLDPRSAAAWGQLAITLDHLYRSDEAILARERELALAPDADVGYAAQASSYLLWRADTAAARRTLERAGPAPAWMVRFPGGIAGGAIWGHVFPPALLHARDTLTLAGYLSGAGGVAPALFHLMKLRHFALTGRADRARAHADSLVALLEPGLRHGANTPWFFGWFSRRSVLAEAYAVLGRDAEAGRETDRFVEETRWKLRVAGDPNPEGLCHALYNAAYVDVLIGRKDVAVARLTEVLGLPCGHRVSRALLRADSSWAPLRGHSGFERLIAGGT
jgi:tetratricopeptide (TPR) repeat protein